MSSQEMEQELKKLIKQKDLLTKEELIEKIKKISNSKPKYILKSEKILNDFKTFSKFCEFYNIEKAFFHKYERTETKNRRLITSANSLSKLPKKYLKEKI